MRTLAVATLLVLSLLVSAVALAAPRRHHHRAAARSPVVCAPGVFPFKSATQPYRRTLAANPVAEIYSLGIGPPAKPGAQESKRRIYGCVYGHRGAYLLGVEPYFQETSRYSTGYFIGDRNIVLDGPIIAYEDFILAEGLYGYKWGVVVKDLRTGATLHHEPTGKYKNSGEPELEFGIGPTTGIVLSGDGSVAWIVEASAAEGRYQIHTADPTGARLVAEGADIDPASLALANNTIYWVQGGQPHTATFN
jgi:hypothetical protein